MIRNELNKVIGSYDPHVAKSEIKRTKLVNKLQLLGAEQETFVMKIVCNKE